LPVNIHDIAKKLNLSITTVSRALDGYDDVSEQTRQKVIQVAQEMEYSPNQAARQLRKRRSDTIGYVLPASAPQFSDPFFSEFIAGLGDEAARLNFDLLVSTAPPEDASEQILYRRWIQGRKVDGFILNRIRLQDWRIQYLSQHNLSFVSFERSLDDARYPYVEVDNLEGVRALISHLVEMGHRKIAYIGGLNNLKIQATRLLAYLQCLEESRIPVESKFIDTGDTTQTGGYQAAQRMLLLPNKPSAIVCFNDLTAIGAMHAAYEQGFTVGQNLAIAGFDGIVDSAYTQPPLTTINQPVYDIAGRLVRMLVSLMHGETINERQIVLNAELIIRESTNFHI
jgi:DNA-binding LacI/PurR family transcriptional regulator